jgi:hypothetical protein
MEEPYRQTWLREFFSTTAVGPEGTFRSPEPRNKPKPSQQTRGATIDRKLSPD